MEKTANLTVVLKIHINILLVVSKPQKVFAERDGCSQSALAKPTCRKLTGMKKCVKIYKQE